jgi:hypothetical protein
MQWGNSMISSCPDALEGQIRQQLVILTSALSDLANIFTTQISDLMPRPALLLMAHTASSLYLLEHAIWCHAAEEVERPLDAEVFRRWVDEGGLSAAIQDVKTATGSTHERILANSMMVYGPVTAKL